MRNQILTKILTNKSKPMETITINKDTLTRESLQQIIDLIGKPALKGEEKALDAFVLLKQIEVAAKRSRDLIQEAAVEEIQMFSGEDVKRLGAKVEYAKGSRNWSFKHIPEHVEAKDIIKDLEGQYKTAAEQKAGVNMVDDDGEIIPRANFTFSSDTVKVTFPKL